MSLRNLTPRSRSLMRGRLSRSGIHCFACGNPRKQFAHLCRWARGISMKSGLGVWRVNLFRICAAAVWGWLLAGSAVCAQETVPAQNSISITGIVVDAAGHAADRADVRLESDATFSVAETKSGADGRFEFALLHAGKYKLTAKKAELHSHVVPLTLPLSANAGSLKLVLEADETGIEFSDKPSFTVAGVTDFTAVGGHGADTILRTSEDLTRETFKLGGHETENPSATRAAVAAEESKLRAAL